MPTSVTTYYDSFIGDGSLNGHVSDGTLGTWGASTIAGFTNDLTISSGAVALPSTPGMFDGYANTVAGSLSLSTGTIAVYSDLTWCAVGTDLIPPVNLGFGLRTSAGAVGELDAYIQYQHPNWVCVLSNGGESISIAYASMPLDTAGLRYGVAYGPTGVATLFTEPLGGGTRTSRGTKGYTAISSAVSLRPFLSALVVGTPGSGGKIDNLSVSYEYDYSVATAHIAPARSRATITEMDGAVSAWTTTPMDSDTSDVALSTTTYDNRATGWLTASLDTSSAPSVLTLTAAIGNLPTDDYTATVVLTSSTATNSPYRLPVTFVPAWQTENAGTPTWTPVA